jgi:hypothetical protein
MIEAAHNNKRREVLRSRPVTSTEALITLPRFLEVLTTQPSETYLD